MNMVNIQQSSILLGVRFALAYGFYEPAIRKLEDIQSVADWFSTLGIPLSSPMAYITVGTETLGVILLTLGLFTRWISLPLSLIIIVAIITVHLSNGFSAADGGYEIPLYYLIFLGILSTFGAGKMSLDYFFFERRK